MQQQKSVVRSINKLEVKRRKTLSMQLYPKRKTDTEYIEMIRKFVERSKWFGAFHACVFILFSMMFLILRNIIYTTDSAVLGFKKMIEPGIHIGIMLGTFGGLLLVFAVLNVIWAVTYFNGQRTERLMLKFHDELKRKEKDFQQGAAPDKK